MNARLDGDAFGFHLVGTAINDVLFHLEVGNAVAQQASDLLVLLKQGHIVAGAGQLLGAGHASRTGTDDGHLLAGLVRGRLRFHPALLDRPVGDGAFDRLDRYRLVDEVQRAGGLARGRADAAGYLGEVVGAVQVDRSFFPVGVVDQIIPVGDLVIHRAAIVAVGNAAIHAARGLVLDAFLRHRNDEFAEVADAVGRRRSGAVLAVDL